MSQIFHPSTNTISRVSLFGLVFFIAFLGWLVMAIDRSSTVTREAAVLEQPVPFSHDHHVGEEGIDCRYCHNTVEQSAFAGMPSTATCMGCHSLIFPDAPILEPVRASLRDNTPIAWTRVYDLPDFVYFNHSIHVAKGIGCTTCHGAIGRMPLTVKAASLQMEWCVSCHRDPAAQVRPRSEVFNPQWNPGSLSDAQRSALASEYRIRDEATLTSCSVCHR
jgi:hypothetical protein